MSRTAYLLAALATISTGAQASVTLTALLNNEQETQPVIPTLLNSNVLRATSFGSATFVINDSMTSMSFQATINNIDFTGLQTPDTADNLTAAHIHAPAGFDETAPPVWGFFGLPDNDISPKNTVVTPFANGVGGTISGTWDTPEGNNTTFAQQVGNILAGLSYINLHTVQFGAGEIRGQIVPIPEPETYALMLAGLGAVAWAGRRRARRALG
jgi:hypothetical protein